jgi:peptidoglycan/LPS O-acetylase OafA/YrhL
VQIIRVMFTAAAQPSIPIREPAYSLVSLDLLRGLAAVMVFLVHTRGASFVEFGSLPSAQKTHFVALLFGITRLGQEAVLIFFVLSGFLVGGQLISRVMRGTFRLEDYIIDRCSRILMPLVPACIFTASIDVFIFREPLHISALFGSMVGLNGVLLPGLKHNAPLWTLAYEIWFYVLGGAVGYIFSRTTTRRVPFIYIIVALCAAVFSILSARYLLYWMIGALSTLHTDTKFKKTFFLFGFVLAVTGSVLFELAFSSKSFTNIEYLPMGVSESLICSGICFSFPALCSARLNNRLLFLRKPASLVSGFSYTLYLFHYPTNAVLDLFLPSSNSISVTSVAHFSIRCCVCLVVSIMFFVFFERNTPAVRRYVKGRILEHRRSTLCVPQARG